MRRVSLCRNGAPPTAVMAGHSRPKDGVATLAYDPAIHDELMEFAVLHGPPGQARGWRL